jgi:hypothetical protein
MEDLNSISERVYNVYRLSQTDPLFDSFRELFFNGRCRFSWAEFAIVSHSASCSLEVIEKLFNMGFNFELPHGTPMDQLIDNRKIDAIDFLLQNGVRVGDQSQYLESAARNGDLEIFNLLIKYVSNAICPITQNNLLNSAIEGGNLEIVNYLLSIGFVLDYNRQGTLVHDIFDYACDSNNASMFEFILENGPPEVVYTDEELLTKAVEQRGINIFEYLINLGKNIDCVKQKYLTRCAHNGDFAFVKLFLQHGADPSANNSEALRQCTEYVSNYKMGMDYPEYNIWWNNRMTAAEILIEYGASTEGLEDRLENFNL